MLEARVVVAHVLRAFHVQTGDGQGDADVMALTLLPANGMRLRFVERHAPDVDVDPSALALAAPEMAAVRQRRLRVLAESVDGMRA